MVLGYARVSKGEEQDTHMQETAFRTAGVARTFTEHASGGRWDRPQLHRLLDQLRPGDVVVVWKLDRLSRSLKDLLHIMEHIAQAGAGFRSLTEAIDTTTPAGRMLMQMVGSFAEFRTGHDPRAHAGRARGGPGARSDWRPPAQAGAPAWAEIVHMVYAGRQSQADAARVFRVHPATVSRLLAAHRQREAYTGPPAEDA
jgi:DNA invertase Pin-like site-specific DNA recombinase